MNGGPGVVVADGRQPPIYANSGGPAGRQQGQAVNSSILGRDDGFVRCPRVIRLGLLFGPGDDPVTVLTDMLADEGYGGPESLRGEFPLPATRLICRTLPTGGIRLAVACSPRRKVLEQALMLGLCTTQVFDPERPVLWTTTSLTRSVELFDARGFYA